jgi:hypothetical protein
LLARHNVFVDARWNLTRDPANPIFYPGADCWPDACSFRVSKLESFQCGKLGSLPPFACFWLVCL